MRIGILSDSHGRAAVTRAAVLALREAGADMLIHLGDIETDAVIDELVGMPAHIVFGNCDFDADALGRYARNVGVTVDDPVGDLEIDGRRVVFTHGHRPRVLEKALAEGAEYILHGHSHHPRDERIGASRVINPGALFRAVRYTACVLEPATDAVELLEIPRPA
ncbi:MAG: YfcE family phosphodiesterase [Phycisphaerales bacterium]|nr:YfcE family phosphodiesterase [Phycisphaerales bacterium]NNM27515.1 YfcE family phosphodiesterase [Phycisphaerales bacterium]